MRHTRRYTLTVYETENRSQYSTSRSRCGSPPGSTGRGHCPRSAESYRADAPLHAAHLSYGAAGGPAVTVSCAPGDNIMIHAAVEVCKAGRRAGGDDVRRIDGRLFRRAAGHFAAGARCDRPDYRRRRARCGRPHHDAVPGLVKGNLGTGHGEGDAGLGEYGCSLRGSDSPSGRCDCGRCRRRGGGAARAGRGSGGAGRCPRCQGRGEPPGVESRGAQPGPIGIARQAGSNGRRMGRSKPETKPSSRFRP